MNNLILLLNYIQSEINKGNTVINLSKFDKNIKDLSLKDIKKHINTKYRGNLKGINKDIYFIYKGTVS